MRKKPIKLMLNRETLRLLSGDQLEGIAGGVITALCTRAVACSASECNTYCDSCNTACISGCGC